jgi:hypothetical protein
MALLFFPMTLIQAIGCCQRNDWIPNERPRLPKDMTCGMWLKNFIAGVLAILSLNCFSQPGGKSNLYYSLQERGYLTIYTTLGDLDKKQQQRFREICQSYFDEQKRAFKCSFLTLDNLAKAAASINYSEVFECLNTQLVSRKKGISIKEKYFKKIEKEFNSIVAFRFLQQESLYDLTRYISAFEIKIATEIGQFDPDKTSNSLIGIPQRDVPVRRPEFVEIYARCEIGKNRVFPT